MISFTVVTVVSLIIIVVTNHKLSKPLIMKVIVNMVLKDRFVPYNSCFTAPTIKLILVLELLFSWKGSSELPVALSLRTRHKRPFVWFTTPSWRVPLLGWHRWLLHKRFLRSTSKVITVIRQYRHPFILNFLSQLRSIFIGKSIEYRKKLNYLTCLCTLVALFWCAILLRQSQTCVG